MTRFATIPETEARRRHRREDEALLLAFLWSGDDLAYFTRSGSRVPQRDVRKAVDAVVATVRTEVAALGRQVASGEIAVAEWQDSTARLLKTLHVAVGAAGAGGFRNMSPGDTAEVEQTLRFNFERLEGFAQDVSEVQPVLRIVPMTESRIVQRSEMYAAAGSAGYENVRRSNAFEVGYKFERNVLHPADHCELCVEQESRGWVGIGELVPIGQRDCLTHCQCSMAFARELPE
jgi:hypothetical protein